MPLNNFQGGEYDAVVVKLNVMGELVWATYIGGEANDHATALHLCHDGRLLVAGVTESTQGFGEGIGLSAYHGGGADAFLAEVSIGGLVQRYVLLGGDEYDEVRAMTVSPAGKIVLVGATSSSEFDEDTAPADAFAGGRDGWLVVVNEDFEVQMLLGGTGDDILTGVALTSPNHVAISGKGGVIPAITALSPVLFGGGEDGIVALVHLSGSLEWAMYSGGSENEEYNSVAISNGHVIVAGRSTSAELNGAGPGAMVINGPSDALLVAYTSGGAILWGRAIGGSDEEYATSVMVDFMGNIYLTGQTYSADFDPLEGFVDAYQDAGDAFFSRWTPDGQLVQSTFLGGLKMDIANASTVDRYGKWIVAGQTHSQPFPFSDNTFLSGGEIWASRISLCNNPIMTIHATDTTIFCDGGNVNFCGSGAEHLRWVNSDTIAFTSANESIDMFLIGTNDHQCYGKSNTIPVVVLERPDIEVIPMESTFYCEEEQVDVWLVAHTQNAILIEWNNNLTGDSIHVTIPANYTATATAANGCKRGSNAVEVEVPDILVPVMTASADEVCLNSSPVQLLGLPIGGAFTGSGISGTYFHPVNAGGGVHEVRYQYADLNTGCVKTSEPLFIEVHHVPVHIEVFADEICTDGYPVELVGYPENGIFTGTGMDESTFYPEVTGAGSFVITYQFIDEFGCPNQASETLLVEECLETSITEGEGIGLNIFPNPATDYIIVDPVMQSNGLLMVHNATGQLVMQVLLQRDTRTMLDVTSLASGAYFVQVHAGGSRVAQTSFLIRR